MVPARAVIKTKRETRKKRKTADFEHLVKLRESLRRCSVVDRADLHTILIDASLISSLLTPDLAHNICPLNISFDASLLNIGPPDSLYKWQKLHKRCLEGWLGYKLQKRHKRCLEGLLGYKWQN
jgi:hypothetical protein